jgi:hypothetical protein
MSLFKFSGRRIVICTNILSNLFTKGDLMNVPYNILADTPD